uniref:Arginyl-tRNA synthetase n=1 Tax=Rhabditophanes sp. KR3021 TaxID=114890 RepID=A0AC35UGF0_9BILA
MAFFILLWWCLERKAKLELRSTERKGLYIASVICDINEVPVSCIRDFTEVLSKDPNAGKSFTCVVERPASIETLGIIRRKMYDFDTYEIENSKADLQLLVNKHFKFLDTNKKKVDSRKGLLKKVIPSKVKSDPKKIAKSAILKMDENASKQKPTSKNVVQFKSDNVITEVASSCQNEAFLMTSNIVHTSLQNGIPNKKKIVIDYSSPNVAKAFHIGNLRSTLIGNFVSNINKAAGNDVVGLNYIGDWGTQFGILLQPFLNEHGIVKHFESLTKKDKMKYMTDLYVEYTKLCKEDPEIKEKAKETFKNLELYFSGDTQIVNDNLRAQIKLFERIRYASIDYLEEFYTKLNVTFDVWTGESNIISEAHKVTNEIIGKGLTEVTADGLTIVRRKNSKEFATIRKSDGASLYLTRDIASILNREKLYEADEYLYVVDRAQLGHFNSVKDVVVQYGRPDLAAKVKHLAFGRVRGLSTRLGKSTSVDDILEKGTQLSLQFLKESPTIKVDNDLELCTIAEELAISTIKINEYQRKVTSDVLAILRVLILVFGLSIVLFKKDHTDVMEKLRHAFFCIAILFCSYSPTKVLFLAEVNEIYSVGAYITIAANFIFSVIAYQIWKKYYCPKENPTDYENVSNVSDGTDYDNIEKEKETGIIIMRLLQFVQREWLWHASGFFWLAIYSLTRIFIPYYTGKVIAALTTTGYDPLVEAVKLMTAISLVSSIAAGLRGGSFELAGARCARIIRNDLFSSLVTQEVGFYDVHKTGEIVSRLAADTQTMADTIPLNLNVFLRNTIMIVGSMIFMMNLSWKLSLITFIVVPIIFVITKIFGSYYDYLSEEVQDCVASSNDVAEEVISTMRTVRSFACEEFEARRYFSKLTDTLDITRKKAYAYLAFIWASELFQTLIVVAVLWYGGHLVLTKRLDGELLVSFLLYQVQLADNLRQVGEVLTALMQSVGASRKVFSYIDRQPHILTDGTYKCDKINGEIKFDRVDFSYPSRPDLPVLKNVSFTINPGQTVALVGPSGSGKSSIIALLEHFYQPQSGKILLDSVPIDEYDHHFIRNKMTLVSQDPVLFNRSIINENITYGLNNIPESDIVAAAKMANAHEFIVALKDHYKTAVGERGSSVSGGQKSRIAIARSLVREPAVLLLDEITSALDSQSEQLVQEAIYKNLKNHTVVMIAHRLSTVVACDKIIVINKGRVHEQGNHAELMAKEDGIYRQLVNRQTIGHVEENPPIPAAFNRRLGMGGPPSIRDDDVGSNYGMHMAMSPRNMAANLFASSFTNSSVHSK